MEILAEQIKDELELRNGSGIYHCAIAEEELQRLWPLNEMDRERKIAQFAKDYGLHLTWYSHGICAIFERKPPEFPRAPARVCGQCKTNPYILRLTPFG
jgi:hypothetical protein